MKGQGGSESGMEGSTVANKAHDQGSTNPAKEAKKL